MPTFSSAGEEAITLTEEDIVEAITNTIDPNSWDRKGPAIGLLSGLLFVTQTKENHEAIAAFLDGLRKRGKQMARC